MGKDKKLKPERVSKSAPSTLYPQIAWQSGHPIFCFRNCQKGYTLSDVDESAKWKALAQRITRWSEMTWEEIRNANRQGLGHEKIPLASLKKSIPACLGQHTNVISTYIGRGEGRLIGIKENGIFRVLWVDHRLDVYDH